MQEKGLVSLIAKIPRRRRETTSIGGSEMELEKIIDFSKVTSKLSIRRKLSMLINETRSNLLLDILNCSLSVSVVIWTIWSTYNPQIFENELCGIVNIIIHAYYMLEFILRLYVAKDYKLLLYSKESAVDIMTTIPYFLYKVTQGDNIIEYNTDLFLRVTKLIDMLRLLRLERLLKYMESDTNKQLTNIVITLLVLVIFFAYCVFVTDKAYYYLLDDRLKNETRKNFPFHYYIFFIMTVISTEGYENPFQQPMCKVLIIFIVILAFLVLPQASSDLINLLSSKSLYSRRNYKIVENIHHIIVTGTVSEVAAQDFFQELFHEDHGGQQKHAIVLMPSQPNSYMENLLRTEDYGPNVFYIQGDPLDDKDLKRCQAEKAKAIVVLCNKQSSDANEEDAKTILQAMVIKKYLNKKVAELQKQNQVLLKPRLCMQLLRPEGKDHYYLSLNKEAQNDQVICVEELKLSLLAKSCLCPGLVSVISNLITSSGEPPKKSELENCEWLEEYWKGKQFEIYKTQLSQKFVGKTFSWIAANIYRNFKAILFALEIDTGNRTLIFNNPGKYIIPQHYKVTGYIISEDKTVADQISNYKIGGGDDYDANGKKRISTTTTTQQQQQQVQQNKLSIASTPEKSHLLHSKKSGSNHNNNNNITEQNEKNDKNQLRDFDWNEKYQNPLANELNRIEEKCHISPQKILLSDVTYTTLENSRIQNHIILCGLVPNLLKFVEPLRAKYLIKFPSIVILHTEQPTEKQWNQISLFSEIYFIKGSAMFAKNLIAANIRKCSTVVILSPETQELDGYRKENLRNLNYSSEENAQTFRKIRKLTRDEEDLLDAKTIFKYKAILKLREEVKRKEKREIQIVTELVSPQNLTFLLGSAKDYSLMRKYGYTQTPVFASGEIYLSSMIDSLICQAYYNSALITVLNQLIVGNIETASSKERDEFGDVKQSNLYQMPVPDSFVNQPFEKLFNYLTKRQDILPIGLFRAPTSRENKFPYVITNPDPQTIINQQDMIFILSQQMPSSASAKWGTPLEESSGQTGKIKINRLAGMSLNAELMLNQEDEEKESEKLHEIAKENEQIVNKILLIIQEIKQLKIDVMKLREELFLRQTKIHEKLRKAIVTELSALITGIQSNQHQEQQQQQHHQYHQDYLNSSSASSQDDGSSRSQNFYNQTTTTQ